MTRSFVGFQTPATAIEMPYYHRKYCGGAADSASEKAGCNFGTVTRATESDTQYPNEQATMIRYNTTLALVMISAIQIAAAADSGRPLTPELVRLEDTKPRRILFVGNSYLYYNDSLHNHVRRIAGEKGPYDADEYEYKSATIGGASLSHHPVESLLEPGRLGIEEPFDLVILQGGSGEVLNDERRSRFREKASELSSKIRATGAEVALYMTHAYVEPHKRYDPDMIHDIERTYIPTANELDALVIPVGLAFERAYEKRPDIELHKGFDGSHPSLYGTYLAACVVYQSIYVRPIGDLDYDYYGSIDGDIADFLQSIAAETVREFYGRSGD